MDTKKMTPLQAREFLESAITSDIVDALDVLVPEQSAHSRSQSIEDLMWEGGRRAVVRWLRTLA